MNQTTLHLDRVPSPLGTLLLVRHHGALVALDYEDYEERMMRLLARHFPAPSLSDANDPIGARAAINAYFAGNLHALDDLPLAPRGTPFQQHVWKRLRSIPPGGTLSYGALAADLGRPAASRAVGAANGLNPIAIVVPCHRVVGANGDLTGYAGGIERKRWLLAHEQRATAKEKRRQGAASFGELRLFD